MSQHRWEVYVDDEVFICKQCYSDNLIPFATFILLNYQLRYDLTNSDIRSLSLRHEKENNKFINKIRYYKFCLLYQDAVWTKPTSSLKCYSNRGMDNFYSNCYANVTMLNGICYHQWMLRWTKGFYPLFEKQVEKWLQMQNNV